MQNKRIFIFSLFHFGIVSGQHIDSVKIIPQNPTTLDSICVVTSVTMATTANGYLGYELSNSGSITTVEACYKHGMLDASETYIDTINLGVMSQGSYSINFIAYASFVSPCDPTDSSDTQLNFSVTAPLSIEQPNDVVVMKLFPNPAVDFVQILSSDIIDEIVIIDATGRIMMTFSGTAQTQTLNIDALPEGIYFVKISSGESSRFEILLKTNS